MRNERVRTENFQRTAGAIRREEAFDKEAPPSRPDAEEVTTMVMAFVLMTILVCIAVEIVRGQKAVQRL